MRTPPPGAWRTHKAPPGLLAASRRTARRSGGSTAPAWLLLAAGVAAAVGIAAWPRHPAPAEPLRAVTLVYRADDAHTVSVAGTFNAWDVEDAPLLPMGDGLFRTVLWLAPGRYEYQFVVDGARWTPDPLEPRRRDDGFGSVNSVLDL